MLLDPLPKPQLPTISYADRLYPKELGRIMAEVMRGLWQPPMNPEQVMDQLLFTWFDANVTDQAAYVRELLAAVLQRQCLNLALARLNVEALSEPDLGDTITICRGRRFRLSGEGYSVPVLDGAGNLVYDGEGNPVFTQMPGVPDETNYKDGQIYADQRTTVVRRGRGGLPDAARQMVLTALAKSGYDLTKGRSAAYSRLETLFRTSDAEQNILARLVFLIAFEQLKKVDSRNFVAALVPLLTHKT